MGGFVEVPDERLTRENKRLQIFDSFLGFVKSSEIEKLEGFAADAAYLVEAAKNGNHSPKLIRNMLIRKLTGGTLQVLKCTQCEVEFVVDKPSKLGGYHCPICGLSFYVKIDKDALAILKAALAPTKNITAQRFTIIPVQTPLKDKGNG